jgi:beta-glucosidase
MSLMAFWGSYRIQKQHAGTRTKSGDAAGGKAVSDIWNRHVAESDGSRLLRPEDIGVLAAMGYRAVQFELLWPAVLQIDGTPNEDGIKRCLGLIETIRQYGMTPIIAACRWERPLWVRLDGGWVNVKSEERYQTYIDNLHSHFGKAAVIRNRPHEPWDAAARELKWLRAFGRNPVEAMASRYRIDSAGGSLAYPS